MIITYSEKHYFFIIFWIFGCMKFLNYILLILCIFILSLNLDIILLYI